MPCRSGNSVELAQVPEHAAFADFQGAGDFGDSQTSVAKFEGSFWEGFGGAGFSALIDAANSGDSDSGRLAFAAVFQFDFSKTKHDAGDHVTDGAGEINLLSDGNNSDALFAPVGQNVDAVFESAG